MEMTTGELSLIIAEHAKEITQTLINLISQPPSRIPLTLNSGKTNIVSRTERLINEAILLITSDSIELKRLDSTDSTTDNIAAYCLLFYEILISNFIASLNTIKDLEIEEFSVITVRQKISSFLYDYITKYNLSIRNHCQFLKRVLVLLLRLNKSSFLSDNFSQFVRLRYLISDYCKWYSPSNGNISNSNGKSPSIGNAALTEYIASSLSGKAIRAVDIVPLSAVSSATVEAMIQRLSDIVRDFSNNDNKYSSRRSHKRARLLLDSLEGFYSLEATISLAQFVYLERHGDNDSSILPNVFSTTFFKSHSTSVLMASMKSKSDALREGGVAMLASLESLNGAINCFYSSSLITLTDNSEEAPLQIALKYCQDVDTNNALELIICKVMTFDAVTLCQTIISSIASCADSSLRNKSFLDFKRCLRSMTCERTKFNLLRQLVKECPFLNAKALLIDMVREFSAAACNTPVGGGSNSQQIPNQFLSYDEDDIISFIGPSPFWSPCILDAYFSADIFFFAESKLTGVNGNSIVDRGNAEVFLSFVCLLKFIKSRLLASPAAMCSFVGSSDEARLVIFQKIGAAEIILNTVLSDLSQQPSSVLACPQISLLAHMLSEYDFGLI